MSDRPSPFAGKPGRKRLWSGTRGKQLRQARSWIDVSVVGIQFPVAIALGFFWGRWMDQHLGTWPWLTGLFSLFGITAGFVNLFRITAAAAREEAEAAAESGTESASVTDAAAAADAAPAADPAAASGPEHDRP